MLGAKKELGKKGETLAKKFLKKKGYRIITTNYHIRGGEIDVVTSFFDKIIFIEVKTRTTDQFGSGEEAINNKKLQSLISTAQKYLLENNLTGKPWQIDLITVDFSQKAKKPEIRHIKNITF